MHRDCGDQRNNISFENRIIIFFVGILCAVPATDLVRLIQIKLLFVQAKSQCWQNESRRAINAVTHSDSLAIHTNDENLFISSNEAGFS